MTRRQIAILFPGQGIVDPVAADGYLHESVQLASMLAEVDPIVRRYDPTADGEARWVPDQPGVRIDLLIYCASIAAYRRLENRSPAPFALLGHGFGEIAALVAGGAFSILEGAEIRRRDCSISYQPADFGANRIDRQARVRSPEGGSDAIWDGSTRQQTILQIGVPALRQVANGL